MTRTRHLLSKTRFMCGLQCPKRLWLEVHEPGAPELAPDPGLQAVFDRGHEVGELARAHVPGGVLIDRPHRALRERVVATAAALEAGARVIYEAAFLADEVFVAVDILERRRRGGFTLVEVKSTLGVKPQHLPDLAIQLHVLRRSGLDVRRAHLMHLRRECRHPGLSNLFVRENVTREVLEASRGIGKTIRSLLRALGEACPEPPPGAQCSAPYPCPFQDRCSPPLPEHHVSTLWNIRRSKVEELVASGHETLHDLPPDAATTEPARRQLRSVRTGKLVVRRRSLRRALAALPGPLAYLDFETIAPAVPVWPGCGPYEQVPVQLSCHTEAGGRLEHRHWLARGSEDPRPGIARATIDACAGARSILAYSAGFERQCLARLAQAVPELARDLARVSARLVDLLPLVRDHLYHPRFGGSFGLKSVAPALVPSLGYDDLEIQDGATASALLEALLLREERFDPAERRGLRRSLRRYCGRDTLAMVRVLDRLARITA